MQILVLHIHYVTQTAVMFSFRNRQSMAMRVFDQCIRVMHPDYFNLPMHFCGADGGYFIAFICPVPACFPSGNYSYYVHIQMQYAKVVRFAKIKYAHLTIRQHFREFFDKSLYVIT